jgi:hypothetical protein
MYNMFIFGFVKDGGSVAPPPTKDRYSVSEYRANTGPEDKLLDTFEHVSVQYKIKAPV